MGDVGFRGGNTPGIFTEQHIFHSLREEQFDFLVDPFIFDDIHRDVGVNEAQHVKVNGNGRINFNDVLSAHSKGVGIHHKCHGMGSFIEAKPIENPDTLPRLNMIDDDPVLYLR
jgi:hypothetical protein